MRAALHVSRLPDERARGLRAMSACGCRVEPDSIYWREYETPAEGAHIVYCARHGAAERLAELVADMVALCAGGGIGPLEWTWAEKARALLREIGGAAPGARNDGGEV